MRTSETSSSTDANLFDKQYSDSKPGFKSDCGMTKAFSNFECNICGRQTRWFHYRMAVYLCSQDCLTRYQSMQR